jgi:putative FmdB family regulatory protein
LCVPVYEYLCSACSNRYDKRESFSAPARQKCPRCGKTSNRVLQAPPIVFKGSGFYATDSRGSSKATTDPPAPATEAKADASAAGESTSTSTETAAAS